MHVIFVRKLRDDAAAMVIRYFRVFKAIAAAQIMQGAR